jgi:hypothetical protein
VTWHPCAAWWCWVDRFDDEGAWQEVGASSSGALALEDGTGRLELDASQCRPSVPPGAEVMIQQGQWSAPGASRFHDGLRRVAGAAGLEQPETALALRFRESLLPAGVTIVARGLVVLVPGGEVDGGYRGENVGTATLCPPPGGLIELAPR